MNSSWYICCFLPLLLVLISQWYTQQQLIHHIQKKRNKKEIQHMLELAKHFINEDCLIYFIGGSTISGVIKEISESGNAILLQNGQNTDVVNLEFVTRIRKYPLDKKGKRKSLILD